MTTPQAIHTNPEKRHDFLFLFDVTDGNPNGNPDAGNMPRYDTETMHGLMTDVAIKRKIRDYIFTAFHSEKQSQFDIFIRSNASLNAKILKGFRDAGVNPPQIRIIDEELTEWLTDNLPEGFSFEGDMLTYGGESPKYKEILKALNEGRDDNDVNKTIDPKLKKVAKDLEEAAKNSKKVGAQEQISARVKLCESYFDIRMFGAVLSTGLNAGQVRGPMQLTFARSFHPVFPMDFAITRQARTTTERMMTGSTEIGRKHTIPYGLYCARGFYSPHLADKKRGGTGVTQEDLNAFWQALKNLFDFDRSAARGEMITRGVYIFTHESPLGNAPAHQLFEMVKINLKDGVTTPRHFSNYSVTVPNQKEVPEGVTLTPLVG
jgi:CRISPR-associated protein Csd2